MYLFLLLLAGLAFLYGIVASYFAYKLWKALADIAVMKPKTSRLPNKMIDILEHALAIQAGDNHELVMAQLHLNEAQRSVDNMAAHNAEILRVLEYVRNAKSNGVNLAAYLDRQNEREKTQPTK